MTGLFGRQESASCAGVGSDLFYPETQGTATSDIRSVVTGVCANCPVWRECRLFGLAEAYGVWGGLSPLDRRAVRRELGWTAEAAHGVDADSLDGLRSRIYRAYRDCRYDIVSTILTHFPETACDRLFSHVTVRKLRGRDAA